ncbi:hypothetical protein HMPREF9372_1021 [Sporosarcina newyorkensis 2681]|uniref:Uncharacterized protein n=1 Tax=Sporosarcina newyorkensis 2681 TaxID=1027292 RepID=F9DQE1_9BACL|nr:hypothetical protein HMPREF9372_1021 [Sporosarcina newyorkensis 2681]
MGVGPGICAPDGTLFAGRAVSRFLLSACAPNASLLLAKAVLRNGFRSVQGLTCHANPAGVAHLPLQSLLYYGKFKVLFFAIF